MKICCPKCEWQPDARDKWLCGANGCGHVWNTFETMGRCPNCGKIWQSTQCFSCVRWSKHMDWYHFEPPGTEELSEDKVEELGPVDH